MRVFLLEGLIGRQWAPKNPLPDRGPSKSQYARLCWIWFRPCRYRQCHNSHKLAEPTTINWPRIAVYSKVLLRNGRLSKHKVAASSALQA